MLRQLLCATALLVLTCTSKPTPAQAGLISFTDKFEGSTLDPFWSTVEQSGSVTFPSTARAHSGSQSVQFNSIVTSDQKWIGLFHDFAEPVYGRFSVWMYDTGANVSSSNYLWMGVTGASTHAAIFTHDFNSGVGATYAIARSGPGESSGIARTETWHQFEITTSPIETTFAIDGDVVATGPAVGVDRITLQMFGPNWRPAFTGYFDDFEVQAQTSAVPEPGSLALLASGAIGLIGLGRRHLRRKNPTTA